MALITAVWFVPALFVKPAKKFAKGEEYKIIKICDEYQSALQKENWMRAFVLHAEINTIFLESNYKTCALVYVTDLYSKVQKQYSTDEDIEKAETEMHNQLKQEGLCSDQILYDIQQ